MCVTKLVVKWNEKRSLDGSAFDIGDIGIEATSVERR
jgi:hypothetical protein